MKIHGLRQSLSRPISLIFHNFTRVYYELFFASVILHEKMMPNNFAMTFKLSLLLLHKLHKLDRAYMNLTKMIIILCNHLNAKHIIITFNIYILNDSENAFVCYSLHHRSKSTIYKRQPGVYWDSRRRQWRQWRYREGPTSIPPEKV